MSIASNTALFSLIGTTFGGNGVSTFNLPDFRGRLPVGYNPGGGLGVSVNAIGEISGSEQVTITINNMPTHTHIATFTGTGAMNASVNQATQSVPGTSGANTMGAPWDGNNLDAINGYVADANPGVSLIGLTTTGTVTNALTGGSIPIDIQNPYLVVNYIIALYGIFPSRN
jgi:microcystin-dependent protein